MKKVGQRLKEERERRHLSLHEIGMSLKINPKILSAIEEGDMAQLPAKTFLRGFVRSYAQYLRLNVDEIVDLFHEEMGSTRPPQPTASVEETPTEIKPVSVPKAAAPKVEKNQKVADENPFVRSTRGNRAVLITVSLVLVILIVGVARLVEKYQKERQVPDLLAATATTSSTTTEPLLSADSVATSDDATIFPGTMGTSSMSTVASSTTLVSATSSSTTLVTHTPTPKPTTTLAKTPTTTIAKPTTTTTIKPTPTPKPTTTTMVSTTVPALTGKPTEVIVEALNKISVTYTLGGDDPKTLELAADQIHTFKSKTKVTLEISDGGSVNIVVNGQDRGVPGVIGKGVKLTYP